MANLAAWKHSKCGSLAVALSESPRLHQRVGSRELCTSACRPFGPPSLAEQATSAPAEVTCSALYMGTYSQPIANNRMHRQPSPPKEDARACMRGGQGPKCRRLRAGASDAASPAPSFDQATAAALSVKVFETLGRSEVWTSWCAQPKSATTLDGAQPIWPPSQAEQVASALAKAACSVSSERPPRRSG